MVGNHEQQVCTAKQHIEVCFCVKKGKLIFSFKKASTTIFRSRFGGKNKLRTHYILQKIDCIIVNFQMHFFRFEEICL